MTEPKLLPWRWKCDRCSTWIAHAHEGVLKWLRHDEPGPTDVRFKIIHHIRCDARGDRMDSWQHLAHLYGRDAHEMRSARADPGHAAGKAIDLMRQIGGTEGIRCALRVLVRGFDEAAPHYNDFAAWSGFPSWQAEQSRVTPELCASIVAWVEEQE